MNKIELEINVADLNSSRPAGPGRQQQLKQVFIPGGTEKSNGEDELLFFSLQ